MFSTPLYRSALDIIRWRAQLTAGIVIVALVLLVTDAYGQHNRRSSPTQQQVEWRMQAGEVDISTWPSEVTLREVRPLLDRFFGALQGRAFTDEQVVSLFAKSFSGTRIDDSQSLKREAGMLVWIAWQTSEAPVLDRKSFAANWEQHLQAYDRVIRTEYFVDRFELLDDDQTRRLAVPFRITGYRGDDEAIEHQGEMLIDTRRDRDDGHWQISSIDLGELNTLRSPAAFSPEVLMRSGPPVNFPVAALVDYFAEGVSVVDIDGDDDLDVFAASKLGSPKLYRNDGRRRFTEIGASLGFGHIQYARSGYFFDWDNDGDQDALILTANRMFLLEARDDVFHDVSGVSNFHRMSTTGLTSATIADFDNDGYLDFYVANYGDLRFTPVADYFDSKGGFQNQLFRNRGDGSFEMATVPAGLDVNNNRWSFSALSFDYDQNGSQDLYVINDYGPNQLYRNRGDMTFEDVTDSLGVSDLGNGMGVSIGDIDNDGREDLYVSNMISHAGKRIAGSGDFPDNDDARQKMRRFAKGNTLFLGREGGYFEAETPVISDAKWAWGNALFDYDNDGDLDIYVTNGMYSNLSRADLDPVFWRHLLAPISNGDMPDAYASGYFVYLLQQESHSFAGYERNRLFQNFGSRQFRDVAFPTGADLVQDSRSVVAADMDGDGALDLVVANRNDPNLVVLWNDLPGPGNFLEVRLQGGESNRNGVGATVDVRCDGLSQRRTHVAGSGYLSQGPHSVWFGLGRCSEVEELKVRWPSGNESVLRDVETGSRVLVSEQ